MPIKRALLPVLACGLAAASATAATRTNDTSWGKPGVSLEEYAIDAGVCAYHATMLDVSDTREARRLIAATRRLEHIEASWGLPGAGSVAIEHRRTVEAVQPERIFERVAELQQQVLDNCLAERGYRQFRLTDEQQRQLRRLEPGSLERRTYLHRLGSDSAVLSRQRLDAPPLVPPQG